MAVKKLFTVIKEGATTDSFSVVDDAGTIKVLVEGNGIISEQQAAVADLNQTIGGTYSQAQVQAISDKVDAILAVLRAHGLIAT